MNKKCLDVLDSKEHVKTLESLLTRSVNLLLVDDEVKSYPADYGICDICKLAQIYVLLACVKMLAYSAKVVEFGFVVWPFVGRVIQRPTLPVQVSPVRFFLFNWFVCHESRSLVPVFILSIF